MKKKLFLLLLTCVMTLVMASVLTKADAATLLDETYVDEFANGIDEEKYTVIGDADEKYTFVEKPGQLKVTNLDYGYYVRTKNPVDVPEGKSLVVQWDIIENSVAGGWLVFMRGQNTHTTPWINMVWQSHNAGSQLQGMKDGVDVAGKSDDTDSQWTVLTRYATNSLMRQVYNADGSAQIYATFGTADAPNFNEASLNKVYTFAAGQLNNSELAHFGFSGNGMSGSYLIDNFKIGYASDETCSDITWVLEDDFETGEHWDIIEGKTQIGGAKYLVADNPADGAAIVYNEEFAKTEGVNKLFEVSLDLDVTSMIAGKAIGLAAGLASDATSAANAPFVGVRKNASGNAELVIMAGGVVAQSADLGAALDGSKVTLNVNATVNNEGKILVVASVGNKTVSAELDSLDGKIAIATMGAEGSVVAKILKLSINSYKKVVEGGRTLSTDFSAPLNKNWRLVSAASPDTNGYLAVEDGKLEFELAGDGAQFGTVYKYVNFELSFDIIMQQFYESDEGEITNASTFVGISFAKEAIDTPFWSANLIYIQSGVIDLLNFAGNARTWLAPENDMHHASNEGDTFKVRVKALDGSVSIYLTNLNDPANAEDDGAEFLAATFHNVNTQGYVSISSTAGANYTIDNYSITNLDGNEITNAAPVVPTEAVNHVVSLGKTLNASVSATDKDNDKLVYELVADNTSEYGALTFNADGTFSFVPSKAVASTSFTYKVTDTEDYSAVATVTINVNTEPVLAAASADATVYVGETLTGSVSATDADNEKLTYELTAAHVSKYGTLTFNEDGTYTFVANADAPEGYARFTYRATDGKAYTAEGVVYITIAAKPQEGCAGSIAASIAAIATLCGAVVVLRKRKENE